MVISGCVAIRPAESDHDVVRFLFSSPSGASPNSSNRRKIQITSDPSGAQVEIEDRKGTTPFETDFPGAYFHEPRMLFGAHLSRPLVARLTLDGCESREIVLTLGPREWVSNNGHKRYQSFLFSSTDFHVTLAVPSDSFPGQLNTIRGQTKTLDLNPAEIVEYAKGAVVHPYGPNKNGSGFIIRPNGLVMTNVHVVDEDGGVFAHFADGRTIQTREVHRDVDGDVVLLKLKGRGFPYLRLSEFANIRQGVGVLAIGSPGERCPSA